MDKIKVLQVFGALNVGGAESRMMDIYRIIDREKCQFDFISLSKEDQFFEKEIDSLGGKIYKINSPRDCGIIKHISDLRNCMRQDNYTAVHAHTSYHCGLVMLAARLEHIPVRISHARTTEVGKNNKLKKFILAVGSGMISIFSTHRFAISKSAGEFLFGKSQFDVIPNSINAEKYMNVSSDKIKELKNSLNIPEGAFVIGMIGRFAPMKNHDFAVRWFAEYLKNNPESVFVLVGDGPLKTDIEKLTKELGVSDKVIFTGVRSDVNELIHVFNVLFFPSLYEGLGGVAIEAQAAGIPCVESDIIPEETDLGLNMILRSSTDAPYEEWTEKVNECKTLEIPSYDIIKHAFDKKGYSIESTANRYLNAYRSKE